MLIFIDLTELWLCSNIITIIPTQIAELINLKVLSFSGNFIDTITNELCSLSKLERLYLDGNKLNSIPLSFQNLKQLQEINLSYNDFDKFPEVLCLLKKLLRLDLSGNDIEDLPMSLKNLRYLMSLHLYETNIENVPAVLSKMHWCDAYGCPVPVPEKKNEKIISITTSEQNHSLKKENSKNKFDDLPNNNSKFEKQTSSVVDPERTILEEFLRSRAQASLAKKLRRRKGHRK